MVTLWNILFYKPLYNSLVALVNILPEHSLLFAVVILTIIVRFIISPLSYKSIKTQIQNKKIQPVINEMKENTPDKQEQAKKTLEIYKKHGVNPFSSFLLVLVQFPIIIALYWVFRDGGASIDPEQLYAFIRLPELVNTTTLGLDLTQKSYLLAALTGITQFIYISLSSGFKNQPSKKQSEQEKVMVMVGKSMKFTLPIMVTIFAYVIGSAVAIYWITSNIFMIFQERYIQKRLKNKEMLQEQAA